MGKEIILTGDRPTGRLHLGHLVGSLQKRIELQHEYKQYVMIADWQALTDNADNPQKVSNNVIEVMLDYLAVGINPKISTIFVQSQIPEIVELSQYYMNLVTLARLQRNPTVKNEMLQKNFANNVPVGFLAYPISQAADITAFKTRFVPAGDDQIPLIEQTCEIVRKFNGLYGEVLVEPSMLLSRVTRLLGLDGKAKMSKSLNNAIFLADSSDTLREKVRQIYTDSKHLKINDQGSVAGNIVFAYLDAFAADITKVQELKEHYQRGGLADTIIKNYLFEVLEEMLAPIRLRRAEYASDLAVVWGMLKSGSEQARSTAMQTVNEVRARIGINYFS